MIINDEKKEILYKAVMSLKTKEECAAFFEDLCTPQELNAIVQRLEVAKLLAEGKVYKDIVEATHASTATISRVNKTLSYQATGGYKTVLDRLEGKE